MFSHLKFLCCFWLIVGVGLSCHVQAVQQQSVTLKRISTAEGLRQGTVNDIYQDSTGFVWLSTAEGLNVYNGYSVKPFNVAFEELKNAYFFFVTQDKSGLFWISVAEHGLYSYDAQTNQLTHRIDSRDDWDKDVLAFQYDEDSNAIWFFTASGVVQYSLKTQRLASEQQQLDNFVEEQFITTSTKAQGYTWLGSNKGLIRFSPLSGETKVISLSSTRKEDRIDAYQQRIRKLLTDHQGRVWVATANGLFVLNEQQLPVEEGDKAERLFSKPLIPGLQLHDLLLEEERLLAASNKGLIEVDLETLEWRTLVQFSNSNQDIFNDRILKLFRDKNNNYWLASNARGVYIWNPKTSAFRNYFNRSSSEKILSSNEIWDIEEVRPNELWIGTSNGLTLLDLNKQTGEFWFTEDAQEGLLSQIYQVKLRNQNELWLATSEGIKIFDSDNKVEMPVPSVDEKYMSIFEDQQSFIWIDQQQQVWLSTLESFFIFNPENGKFKELTKVKEAVNPYFSFGFIGELPGKNMMLLSASGQLWGVDSITHEPRLLYELESYTPQEFVYVDNFYLENEKGLIWLSFTSQGLVALAYDDFSEVKNFNRVKTEEIDVSYGLLPDSHGRLWFSSHKGIYNYGLDNQHLMNFDLSYGLAALEFNGGAWEKLISGKMIYGSVKGLTLFDPDQIGVAQDPHKKVVIDGVSLANRNLPDHFVDLADKTFHLNYDDAGLQITFSTLGLEQQSKVVYQYALNGSENINYPASTENTARFSQLSSGKYEFVVRAISPVTGFTTKPSSIKVIVGYAPWSSPLAKFAYTVVILTFVAALLYRRRVKQRVLTSINKELVDSEQRLRMALRSSQSEAWEWHRDDKLIRFVGSANQAEMGKGQSFRQHCQQIHPDDRAEFMREWKALFDSDATDAFSFTYRVKQSSGEYHWYSNVGQILMRNSEGQPHCISGLFTDVNEAQTAYASAMVFGEAFRNTKDWVLIIDSDFNGVMANNSFYRAFNYAPDAKVSLNDAIFGGLTDKMRKYRQIMVQMSVGEHWHGEDNIAVPGKNNRDVLINISLISIENREKNHYVVIFTDITQQKKAEQELKLLANYDTLTQLPNRTLLIDRMEHAIQVADRNRNTLAVLFVDLDRFKQINDSLGHDHGDKLLQAVASRLKERVRKQDTVARLGGDEFVVLLESFKDVTQVGEVAQDLNRCIAESIDLGEHNVSITPSIGIALYPGDARVPEELLRDADIAMYHAKKDPGKCYHFYTEAMDVEVREKLQKESKLKRAQASKEFVNYYQPILDAKSGKVAGAELLLRWVTPEGIVAPNHFIPMAEQIGLIIPMTNDALRRGLADTKAWRKLVPNFYVSINLSVTHFEQDGVAEGMMEVLTEFDLPASALRVEVTESALMSHPEKAITTMERFQVLGVQLALDDFGTGYSSFAYLKRLPLNIVKLDRSFVWGIGSDNKDETIVEAILGLASNLGLAVVAEGVETELHKQFLQQRICQYFQGFYFAKPMGFAEFGVYLQSNLQNGQA